MRAGVTVVDPATTWVDVDVTLEPDAVLEPNTLLRGTTTVAAGAAVGPNCLLVDTAGGRGRAGRNTTSYGAVVGPDATVGPYTYLRPGTRLGRGAKAGRLRRDEGGRRRRRRQGAAPVLRRRRDDRRGHQHRRRHDLRQLRRRHQERHHVGRHSFVGSDSVLVAPVEIADGAYIAAGSTVTDRVGPGELAVARGTQRNIAGWVARRRAGTRTAAGGEQAAAAGRGRQDRDGRG